MSIKTRAKKFFLVVKDDRFENRLQSSIISTLYDDNDLYLSQYGKIFTEDELGNFDIVKLGARAVLEFYPLDGRNNEYRYSFISYDTKQNILDFGGYNFGNTASIKTNNTTVSSGSSATLYTIPPNFRSAKVLVELSGDSKSNYEYNELNLVSDGANVYFSEFGRITSSENEYLNQVGIGTYNISVNSSGVDILFYSDVLDNLNCNIVSVSIANTSFNTISSKRLRHAEVRSKNINISESPSPVSNVVTTYSLDYNMGYFIVQIKDNTNGEIQLSEVIILNSNDDASIIEYGSVYSNSPLGSFDCNLSSSTELLFTPNPNINVTITLLQHIVSYAEFSSSPFAIIFGNSELTTGISEFTSSSDLSFKKDFDLNHKTIPIFQSMFDGSSQYSLTKPSGVDLDRNLIYIPNHFFTDGERVEYLADNLTFLNILDTTTTSTASIGTDIINVASTLGLSVDDYFGDTFIKIIDVDSTSVSLSSTISSQINSGVAVTFYGLFDSESSFSNFTAIGIGQTYISGIGLTDRLGGELYVYKYDRQFIGLCTSPFDALTKPPKLINLTNVGVGVNHSIIATNQNSKCIIAIDNVIQSPIVSTAITESLLNNIDLKDSVLHFSGISSFFGGDLIKIDNEIMKVSSVGVGSTSFVEVQRSLMGTELQSHTQNALITKVNGNYNIVRNKIYFSDSPYGSTNDSRSGDANIRSSFQGRVFLRSGIPNSNQEVYEKNYIFDNISQEFNAKNKNFTLKSNGQSIAGFSTSNSIILVNDIFQSPEDNYNLTEDSAETQLNFTGTATSALYDPNNAGVPRGGIILSVGSSNGFGYQPLVAAGGTAIISIAGTIQSISIGNSGSGYRHTYQSTIRVGVQTSSTGTPNIEYIGVASAIYGNIVSVAITNPGSGYTSTNPPLVVFDDPLSYSNLELVYHSGSSGIGSQAKINIVVGSGSSIIDFNITNYGYSYKQGDILTVDSGGLSGIPTDTSKPFQPFLLTVERTYTDTFSGWSIGELQKLDDIDSLFDGFRKTFPISDNKNRFAIFSKEGSGIDLNSVLLIFINDVLQEPNISYSFEGGGFITFKESPKKGDKCRILFYKGTPNIDVVDVDVLETLKKGDTIQIIGEGYQQEQNTRLVYDIILPNVLETNPYNSVGITSNLEFIRPVKWSKQRNDTIIDGIEVNKDRIGYEPIIYPTSSLIKSVSAGSTQLFVDSVKSIFDAKNENAQNDIINKIEIIDNSNLSSAFATAIISSNGSVDSIVVNDGGVGYTTNPTVSIQNPIGIGSTGRAILRSAITNGIVTSVDVSFSGYGYTFTNPPLVFIEPPSLKREYIEGVSYFGDFGIISGINTGSVGFASTALIFDLYIPQDSYLRDSSVTDPIIQQSQVLENYYIKVSNSNIGNGVTSLSKEGSIIGIGTTGIDNIYQIISVSTGTTNVYGVGSATVKKVTVSVSGYNGLTGIGYSSYFGDYSWGIINVPTISNQFLVNRNYGVVGLNSTPIVRRYNQLGIIDYNDL